MLKKVLLFLIIIGLAAFLRLYQLGENPPGLDWDEASLGWNAYSILKTGTDEYGKFFPVSIRSFNDYKPPLYVYAAVPSIAIFGLNEFAVRFPSALAGIFLVGITFFLCRALKLSLPHCYIAALLIAVSPWAIQFSRGAFEANLALFFFVTGSFLLLKFLSSQKNGWFLISGIFYIFSIYSYHSPRLIVPAFLFLIFIFYKNIFLKKLKYLFLVSCFLFLLLYPLARNSWHVGSLTARLSTVQLVSSPREFLNNYFSHYNFDFLFLNGDGNLRHHAPDFGLLYLIEAPFIFAGAFFLIKNRPRWWPFIVSGLLTAPLASAITVSAPHAVRSLEFLPVLQIITAYGIINLLNRKLLFIVYCSLFIANFSVYFHQYFVHFPVEFATGWQYGYKQMVQKVLKIENQYDRIFITSAYDQPYIYFLFYGRVAPIIKNDGYFYSGFDKYEFNFAKKDPRGLYVIAPEDKLPGFTAFDKITFPNGKTAFLFGTIK